MRSVSVLLLMSGIVAAQTPVGRESHVLSGTVSERGASGPIADAAVRTAVRSERVETKTDASGHYAFRDLPDGQYEVSVAQEGRFASKVVTLRPGLEDPRLNFVLAGRARISGRVFDQNREPVAGARVSLIAGEYEFGALRDVLKETARTDDKGEYRFHRAVSGRTYFILAEKQISLPAISTAPADPKARRPALAPTWYPDSSDLPGAAPVVTTAGTDLTGLDIQLRQSPSYCIDGRLSGNSTQLSFLIGYENSAFGLHIGGTTGQDGRFRVCDLGPGNWRLTAVAPPSSPDMPPTLAEMPIAISRNDVHNVTLVARPAVPISGRVVWEGPPRETPMPSRVDLMLMPATRYLFGGEKPAIQCSIPGEFSYPVLMGEYLVRPYVRADGVYIKDITYDGFSVLAEPLRVGGAVGNAELRVILKGDGGSLRITAADKEGAAVPNASVVIAPAGVATESALAAVMVRGEADQDGLFASDPMAPGKYRVVATASPLDNSAETMGRLMRVLSSKATDVEIGPNQQLPLTLVPIALE